MNASRRQALLVFVLVAALVWWRARSGGFYLIVGMRGEASADLGPLLPAICGGLSASLILLIADHAAGRLAGWLAAILLVSLPGFLPLHRESLSGPPLITIILVMLGAMVHAPRFSLEYGTLGAVGGFFIATEGVGLPLAAAAWAWCQRFRERGTTLRVALALAPTVLILGLAHLLGGAWPQGIVYGWRGGLDRGIRAAGSIIGNQLVPGVADPVIRWAIAIALLVGIAMVALTAWRRARRSELSAERNLYPVAALIALALVIGLIGRALLVEGSPEPDRSAIVPLAALTVLVLVVSLVRVAKQWSMWARSMAGVVVVAWVIAAWRG